MPDFDLSIRNLTKSFGRVRAVADVSFDVRPGEIVSLLGPSGCGKTTTLRAIVGLTRPGAGTVVIKGRDVTRLPVHKRNIGMLFQNYALFPHLTVAENLAFGLKLRSMTKAKIAEEVAESLDLVNLTGYGERYVNQLSGGQQQRVALARALIIRPDLLLLDEPFGALDKKLRERMQIEMKNLQQRLGITTILVTHDQEEALTLSDTIIVMKDGKIEQMGAPSDVYERPASAFVADFIGVSNMFRGTLQRRGSRWHVETEPGVVLQVDGIDSALRDGNRVLVAVRPEKIRITAPEGANGHANTIPVTIEQMVYRGVHTYLYLAGPKGLSLIATTPSDEIQALQAVAARKGTVTACWDAGNNHVIAETN